MIFSKELMFSDDQTVAESGPSTNVIDLGAPGTVLNGPSALVRDIGKGKPIPIYVQLMGDANDGSDTLVAELEVSATENFASATTVAVAPTITGGSEGDRVGLYYIPQGTDERYMRLNYTLTGASASYDITAGIVLSDHTNV